MTLFLQVVAVAAIVFGLAVAVTGRSRGLVEVEPDGADNGFPEGRPLRPADVDEVKFALALRGYRMSEVDDALDRLARELAERDALVADLRAQLGSAAPAEEPAAAGWTSPGTDVAVDPVVASMGGAQEWMDHEHDQADVDDVAAGVAEHQIGVAPWATADAADARDTDGEDDSDEYAADAEAEREDEPPYAEDVLEPASAEAEPEPAAEAEPGPRYAEPAVDVTEPEVDLATLSADPVPPVDVDVDAGPGPDAVAGEPVDVEPWTAPPETQTSWDDAPAAAPLPEQVPADAALGEMPPLHEAELPGTRAAADLAPTDDLAPGDEPATAEPPAVDETEPAAEPEPVTEPPAPEPEPASEPEPAPEPEPEAASDGDQPAEPGPLDPGWRGWDDDRPAGSPYRPELPPFFKNP